MHAYDRWKYRCRETDEGTLIDPQISQLPTPKLLLWFPTMLRAQHIRSSYNLPLFYRIDAKPEHTQTLYASPSKSPS